MSFESSCIDTATTATIGEVNRLQLVVCYGTLSGMEKDYVATPRETVESLLVSANRVGTDAAVPVRRVFVQKGTLAKPEPGALSLLVHNGDQRGLDLYLLLKAVASAAPYNSHRGAAVWARALRHTARTASPQTVSKIWRRLAGLGLVHRGRDGRLADVTLLHEDGSGEPYVHPSLAREAYLQLPVAYWLNDDEKWCSTLKMPAKAMLLIGLSLQPGFILPVEKAPEWYGISADTAQRGLAQLERRGALERRNVVKKAPLSPLGFSTDSHFTLVDDLARPKGRDYG